MDSTIQKNIATLGDLHNVIFNLIREICPKNKPREYAQARLEEGFHWAIRSISDDLLKKNNEKKVNDTLDQIDKSFLGKINERRKRLNNEEFFGLKSADEIKKERQKLEELEKFLGLSPVKTTEESEDPVA